LLNETTGVFDGARTHDLHIKIMQVDTYIAY